MALFGALRQERAMALLLISHDLGLVSHHVDRVVVLYAGHAVEEGSARDVFSEPLHPYTRGLLDSMPGMKGPGKARRAPLRAIPGNVPHPNRVPSGCPFRDRCEWAAKECAESLPPLELKASAHRARCLRVDSRV
jgi:oligopeptide/dipeptide ABC transporter ATP-binding protein